MPIAVGLGLGAGALLFSTDGSSRARPPTERDLTRPVAFYADSGDSDLSVLNLGGLTISATCRDHGGRVDPPILSVTASTAFDDSMIGVSFSQRAHAEPVAYAFGLSDFDRDYGPWDFLGTDPVNTVGTLVFSRPDGAQVTLGFLADRGTAQGECAFSRTATYAPAAVTGAASEGSPTPTDGELGVTYAYLGVSCPMPNSIACDRVGLYVSTRQPPAAVVATVAGHQFELDRHAGEGRNGGTWAYEGFLRTPGLLHRGPLAVEANADDRWLGAPPVRVPVELRAVFDDGVRGPTTKIDIPLRAGYG